MKENIKKNKENISTNDKWQALLFAIKEKKSLALACSGGLDSRLLAYAFSIASQQYGTEYKVLHIQGCHIPQDEENILQDFSTKTGIVVHSYDINPLSTPEVQENGKERCYYCKKKIFSFLKEKASQMQLCDGTNIDDLSVYRPGLKALKELNVLSPFVEVGITKEDIRNLAKQHNLPNAEQPSQACLITRFNYGIQPTKEELQWLDSTERQLQKVIPFPFRLRCTREDLTGLHWELHIELNQKNKSDNVLTSDIKSKIANLDEIKNNKKREIEVIFVDSLRGYFDK